MPGTVNAANLRIGVEYKQVMQALNATRKEINALAKAVDDARSPLQKYHRDMDLLMALHGKGVYTNEQLIQTQELLARKYGVTTAAMEVQGDVAARLAFATEKLQAMQNTFTGSNAGDRAARLAFANDQLQAMQRTFEGSNAGDRAARMAFVNERIEAGQKLFNQTVANDKAARLAFANEKLEAGQKLFNDTEANERAARLAVANEKLAAIQERFNAALQRENQIRAERRAYFAQEANRDSGIRGSFNSFIQGTPLGRLAGPAAIAATASFAGREVFRLTSELEQSTVAMEVLSGSAVKAGKLIEQMRDLDIRSPLNFQDIAWAGKTIISYGESVEKTMPALEALGNISLGNTERFRHLAYAYGQVASAGRLMAQENLQMINAGFNPLSEVARKLNITMDEARQMMLDGKVSFKLFTDAIISATTEGGRFNGMLERMENTIGGKWSKAMGQAKLLATDVGSANAGGIKGLGSLTEHIIRGIRNPPGPVLPGGSVQGLMSRHPTVAKGIAAEKAEQDRQAEIASRIKRLDAQAASKEKWDGRISAAADFLGQGLDIMSEFMDTAYDASRKFRDDVDKSREALEKAKQEENERRDEEVMRFVEGLGDEEDKLMRKLEEINRLKQQGLDAGVADEERKRLIEEEAERQSEDDTKDLKVGAINSTKGSVELYKAMLADKSEQRKAEIVADAKRKRMVELLEKIEQKEHAMVLAVR